MKLKFFIKNISRSYLPEKIYKTLYVFGQRMTSNKSIDEIKRLSVFTKSGFYQFSLDDITFPIMLDVDNHGVDHVIAAYRNFEPGILRLIRKNINNEDIFVDVGANIGQHSLYAAHFCKHVYAFEPIERLCFQFLKSVYKNELYNIHVFNYGLGNEDKEMNIFTAANNMGSSSVIEKKNRINNGSIKIKRLDDIRKKCGIEKVDFMKVDVEGYEWEVLQGVKQTLLKWKPKIILEYSPDLYNKINDSTAESIFIFLKELNYTIVDVDNDGSKYDVVNDFNQIKNVQQTNLYCYQ